MRFYMRGWRRGEKRGIGSEGRGGVRVIERHMRASEAHDSPKAYEGVESIPMPLCPKVPLSLFTLGRGRFPRQE